MSDSSSTSSSEESEIYRCCYSDCGSDSHSYKNSTPNEINMITITEINKDTFIQTPESVLASVREWGGSIEYVKDEFITYELCSLAINTSTGGAIQYINRNILTEEEYYNICLQSVAQNGGNIVNIPEEVHTQELTDRAIENSSWALADSLDKFKTYENCLSAVKRYGHVIDFVPTHFITKEICESAIQSKYPCLDDIPKEFITKELCKMAVSANGENLKWVPDEFMSSELAYIAITTPDIDDPYPELAARNIRHIKAQFLTKEIIMKAIKDCPSYYGTIPKECITEDIEDKALDIYPYSIKYMKQTPERCMKAFKMKPYIIYECLEVKNITRELVEQLEALPKKKKKHIKKYLNEDDLKYIMSLLDS
jgi:hypothetical protein